MVEYHHHPDNVIYVRDGGASYMDTPENFAKDFGAPAPALPEGMIECIYEPGGRHVYFDKKQNAHSLEGVADSAEHEAVCRALDALLAAQAKRVAEANAPRRAPAVAPERMPRGGTVLE